MENNKLERLDKLSWNDSKPSNSPSSLVQILEREDLKSIVRIKKEQGVEVVQSALSILIAGVNDFFNLPQPMKPSQIKQTAELIMERYYFYKLEEFQLCFKNAMGGDYGTIYNRLDGAVIFEWLKKFDTERDRAVEIKRNAEQARNNMYEIFASPAMQQVLNSVVNKMESKKETPAPEPKRELTPFEREVQKEWNSLSENQFDWRLRHYAGEWMDFTTFRKLRFNEEINEQDEY